MHDRNNLNVLRSNAVNDPIGKSHDPALSNVFFDWREAQRIDPNPSEKRFDGADELKAEPGFLLVIIMRCFRKLDTRVTMKTDRDQESDLRISLKTVSAGIVSTAPLSRSSQRFRISARHDSLIGKSCSKSRVSRSLSARNARDSEGSARASSVICASGRDMEATYGAEDFDARPTRG